MVVLHQAGELQYWFVSVFSGSWAIFEFLGIISLAMICAYFRMTMSSFVIMLVIFGGILSSAGEPALHILLILVLAPLFFWITRKIVD